MAKYLISYDYHKIKNYQPLYDQLTAWKAAKLLESVWLVNLKGTATAVRNALQAVADADDSFAIIELQEGSDWATTKGVKKPGVEWLKKNIKG
jgi:hypothetical protein